MCRYDNFVVVISLVIFEKETTEIRLKFQKLSRNNLVKILELLLKYKDFQKNEVCSYEKFSETLLLQKYLNK